ncbi:hypothetical protein I316_05579 [Kwoniella heveanensis BCC8398]|uniref:Exostosin GT47 domain-containing protein n=1 Tax=Kwoniella heveanensis BCC8398 TaxID=1296120 RepID=A0A1B9GNU9_9TREE|nr:hypothetical protein I316_05579 [Kwoniella heveanensis BCC8398]
MSPSALQVLYHVIQKPRYILSVCLLIALSTLYLRWSNDTPAIPLRSTNGASTGSSWEALAGLTTEYYDDEDEGMGMAVGEWGQGVKGWLGWNKDQRRTLLITGGAGQLGQSLIPALVNDWNIQVIDIAPRPTSLPKSVIYHRDSILPSSAALSSLFSSNSFDGVIHLAGVSLESWCRPKENECHEVNVGATEELLKQVENTITQTKRSRMWGEVKTPWVILASSMDVFGPDNNGETPKRDSQTAVGRTKAKAEEALEKLVRRYASHHEDEKSVKATILRFSDVYGYSQSAAIPETFINSLFTNALTGLPIQYSSDAPPLDLLHVDDAVSGILKAILKLEDTSLIPGQEEVEAINLVQGQRWKTQDIVEVVRTQSHSMSPIRDIGDKHTPELPMLSAAGALQVLGWKPTISPTIGLGLALEQLSEEIAEYSRQYHHQHCAPTADFPASDGHVVTKFVEDERNRNMKKLEGCTVNMAFDHEGWLHHVKCEDGKHCMADGQKVTAMNWNQSVFIVRQVKGGPRDDRVVRVVFEEEKGMGYLGYKKLDEAGSSLENQVGLELFKDYDKGSIEFDVEVNPHASFLRLLIPGTDNQIHAVSNTANHSTIFTIEHTAKFIDPHFDMRLNVLCCPSEGDWPLLLDDYESADMRFGSTGQIPFNTSRRLHLCGRAERAVRYNFGRLSEARQAVNKVENGQEAHVWKGQHGANTKSTPHSWALKQLPACWNDCNSPAICVQTGDCKCVQADQCQPKRENPILSLWPVADPKDDDSSSKSHLGSLAGYSPVLVKAVSKVDWHDVLLPAAREAITAHPEFVKVHVADGYKGQAEIEAAPCHNLQTKHCFSADSIMYKALRHMQVPAEEAELVVIPVYQQCTGTKFLLHDGIHHAMENIPGIKSGEKTMALVLTHDWGICVAFSWEIWSAREQPLYPDWILNNVLVWSVMGDYDSPCYRPPQDVVVPARTCQSINLRETFPDAQHIKPMRERTNLLTWSGTYWGTGKSDRLRLTCERGGAGQKELIKGKGAQSNFESWDYMNDLNNARFCPQPRGIAGWSPRTNDAIFAGCIPVLIAEGSHYPFASFLDWSKFSVRVAPTELDRIEQILAAIPLSKVEEMQANLVSVREAFMYSTDERPEDELDRRGPMFFALHEAGLRVRTRYPIKEKKAT